MIDAPQVYDRLSEVERQAELWEQHSDSYYTNNFIEEDGIIRRMPLGENEMAEGDGLESHGYMRHIELIKVLKYFTKEVKMKFSNFIGNPKKDPSHNYAVDTFCCCGERSSLYICEHIDTGMKFYLGSECIKKFDPDFDDRRGATLKYGCCKDCDTPLRCKTNNKKRLDRNYCPKRDNGICFDCEDKKRLEQLEKRRIEQKKLEQERIKIEIEVKRKARERAEREKQEKLELEKKREQERLELEKRKKWKSLYIPYGDEVYERIKREMDNLQNEGKGLYKVKVVDGILPNWLSEYKLLKFAPEKNKEITPYVYLDGVKLIFHGGIGFYITNAKLGGKLIPK